MLSLRKPQVCTQRSARWMLKQESGIISGFRRGVVDTHSPSTGVEVKLNLARLACMSTAWFSLRSVQPELERLTSVR